MSWRAGGGGGVLSYCRILNCLWISRVPVISLVPSPLSANRSQKWKAMVRLLSCTFLKKWGSACLPWQRAVLLPEEGNDLKWPIPLVCFWLGPCVLINFYKWIMGYSHNPVGWQRNCMVFCCNIKNVPKSLILGAFCDTWKLTSWLSFPPHTLLGFLWPFFPFSC